MTGTHRNPMPNVHMSTNFLYVGSRRANSEGNATVNAATSVMILPAPVVFTIAIRSPQCPSGIVLSQLYAKGWHIVQPPITAMTRNKKINAIEISTAVVTFATGKSFRYRSSTESLQQLRLNAHSPWIGNSSWLMSEYHLRSRRTEPTMEKPSVALSPYISLISLAW